MIAALTVAETADWLRERDDFLILTHRRPDGDAIGCAAALANGLREYGKTAYVLHNPDTTPRYLQFVEEFIAPDGYDTENVITVDTASTELFHKNSEKYIGRISLCIDHHPSNSGYGILTCLDGSCAACGEVIYDILLKLAGNVSAKSAEGLYIALSTDTGCFAYANTTANTLRVAAALVEAGAPQRELNRLLFRTKTRGRVKIEGLIYSGIEFHFDDEVAITTVTRQMMREAGADEDDVDDIASIPGSIKGVRAGITLRELSSENDVKVSVRTGPSVNSHDICVRFGGGGHPMAAGFTLNAPVAEVKERLLKALMDFFPGKA
ncbi:MAG: DHH family phosphoesterase [Oscillospiraceae bacterium]|nr:DHH family phosphoesterase [Oscillospiraceae bacterium]